MIVESVTFELVRYITKAAITASLLKSPNLEQINSQLNAEEEICIDRLEFTVHVYQMDTETHLKVENILSAFFFRHAFLISIR